ncbi:caspase family protein [Streptomyces sp. NPDC002851]
MERTSDPGPGPGEPVNRALLIGVWDYTHPRPVHDRKDVLGDIGAVRHNLARLGAALADGGVFDVEVCENPGLDECDAAIQRARDAADGVLLVYFAGHGILAHGHQDRLLLGLRDARIEGGQALSYPGWAVWSDLLPMLSQSKAERVVAILDCCYSGHASAAWDRLPEEPRRKTSLLWSVQRQQRTDAGDADTPTPYTEQLVRLLREGTPVLRAGAPEGATLRGLARDLGAYMERHHTTLNPRVPWMPGHNIVSAHEDLLLARGGPGPRRPLFVPPAPLPDEPEPSGGTEEQNARTGAKTEVERPLWRRLLLPGAVLLGLGGGLAAALWLFLGGAPAACGTARELRLLTDPELESTVRAAADRYLNSPENRTEDGCRRSGITVFSAGADDAVVAFRDHYEEWKQPPVQGGGDRRNPVGDVGPQPDIWIPASATSAERAKKPDGQPAFVRFDAPVPLASSRIVLAMPDTSADKDGGGEGNNDKNDKYEGNNDSNGAVPEATGRIDELIRELRARDPQAEVRRADPEFTGSALLATVGLYAGAADPAAAERRVAQPGVRSLTGERLLCDLAEDGAQDRHTAVLVPEFVLRTTSDCRWGAGTRRTVAYPEGTPVLDPAFVRVRWDAAERDKQERDDAVAGFLAWLRSADGGQKVFAEHGFRGPTAGQGPAAGQGRADTAAVDAALKEYRRANGAGRVLFLLDSSGSMADLWEGTGGAPNVLAQSFDGLGRDDEYAVWAMASPDGADRAYDPLFSFTRYGDGARDKDVRKADVAQEWQADPGPALRAALEETARRGTDDTRPSLVVLLTDDEDNARMSKGEQDDLVAYAGRTEVPVVVASFDSGGCTEGGFDDRIALASGGRCLSPGNSDDLTAALRNEVARVGSGEQA